MILSEVRDYLRQRGQATLADIALHFDITPEVARGMLEVWMDKGKVSKHLAGNSACGDSCTQCDPAAVEMYVWGGRSHSLDISVPCADVSWKPAMEKKRVHDK